MEQTALTYEDESNKYYLGLAAKDEMEMKASGMAIITLEGAAAKNYVNAANAAVWKRFGTLVGAETAAKFKAKFVR